MERRTFLGAAATGVLGTTAGCLGIGDSSETGAPPDDRLSYPLFPPSYYDLEATRNVEADGPPTPFSELPRDARLQLASAVHRGRIFTADPPADRGDAGAIRYRDETWDTRTSVADYFTAPEHGPEGDPDWRDPITLSVEVADGELTLTLTNALETTLPVHYRFEPAFGVLVAVQESTAVLDHPGYDETGHVRTDGVVRADPGRPGEGDETIQLSPGESLAETYSVPDDLTGEAAIRPSIWIGDESFDLLANRRQLLVATITPAF